MKTFLKSATILSVNDYQNNEKVFLGKFIFGIVAKDETNRFSADQRVITSTIKSQDQSEYITKSGNTYFTSDEPKKFDISFVEYVVMRHRLHSPDEILEMRQTLKLTDDRIMH